ncbi:unnamed protein product [Ranitomeya imitator]|uniref:Uncharacterized protein n=1 Tax=Ranitomeya imitator TaxID=111125 RepID=A0ABN9LWS0_9NEOB|nr:unnamed protein product [Ranitomeya imitator]
MQQKTISRIPSAAKLELGDHISFEVILRGLYDRKYPIPERLTLVPIVLLKKNGWVLKAYPNIESFNNPALRCTRESHQPKGQIGTHRHRQCKPRYYTENY